MARQLEFGLIVILFSAKPKLNSISCTASAAQRTTATKITFAKLLLRSHG